jgi:protein SCO1
MAGDAMNKARSPFAAALAGLMLVTLAGCDRAAPTPQGPLAGAAIGGPLNLVDQDGRRVSDAAFAGRYRMVYFGYSFCPDICPVDLQHLMQGFAAFERAHPEEAAKVQPIFVTIDPERDTPATLKPYVAAFHPRLIGLTGTPAEIKAVAKAYGVYYAKAEVAGASDYLMDHSRQAYLFGPDGKPIALLPQDENGAAVAAELAKWVK